MRVVRISVPLPGDAMVTKDCYLVTIEPRYESRETRGKEQGKEKFFRHALLSVSGRHASIARVSHVLTMLPR